VALDIQLTWSAQLNQVGKKIAQRLGVLNLFNRRSSMSIGNCVLFYKKLIRPMMDYACPIWRSAARSHVRKLHVLQSKCLRIATIARWCVGNNQIHEDFRIPFFADHIRALTESFDTKLPDAGKPLLSATWKALMPIKGWLYLPTGNRGGLVLSRPAEAVRKETATSAQREVSNYSAILTEIFRALPQL
jgi:hypothetical protein